MCLYSSNQECVKRKAIHGVGDAKFLKIFSLRVKIEKGNIITVSFTFIFLHSHFLSPPSMKSEDLCYFILD